MGQAGRAVAKCQPRGGAGQMGAGLRSRLHSEARCSTVSISRYRIFRLQIAMPPSMQAVAIMATSSHSSCGLW